MAQSKPLSRSVPSADPDDESDTNARFFEPGEQPQLRGENKKTRDNEGLEPHAESDEPLTATAQGIRDASLFDQFSDESHPDAPETVEPEITADEVAALDEHQGPAGVDGDAREAEQQRMREALRQNRDRRSVPSDQDTWDRNRHSDGSRR